MRKGLKRIAPMQNRLEHEQIECCLLAEIPPVARFSPAGRRRSRLLAGVPLHHPLLHFCKSAFQGGAWKRLAIAGYLSEIKKEKLFFEDLEHWYAGCHG
jgi:hypothetical protein